MAIRVLIVDDHQTVAEGLEHVLRAEDGIEPVGRASSVVEAVQLAAELAPDVVLMDQRLPDGKGCRAAEVIKLQRPETKVLLLTGFVDDGDVVAAIEAGCSGYLTKDTPMSEVVSAIRAAHAGETLIPPAVLTRVLPRLTRAQRARGWDLSAREIEVLRAMADGMTTDEIAIALSLSVHTVRNHIQRCLSKLDSHSKLEAVTVAVREGIIDLS